MNGEDCLKMARRNNFENVLLDTLPNPIYYKSIKGNFIKCNTHFAKLANISKEEVVGKTAYDFFPKDVANRNKIIDAKIMKTLQPLDDEIYFDTKNGNRRYYNLNKAVCFNENNEIAGIVCIMTDMTERTKIQESFIQRSKFLELGELIASIAHQWNEPLVELSAQIQKVAFSYKNNKINKKEVSEFVKDSMTQIQYMSETLTDFRNFLIPSSVKNKFGIKKSIEEIFKIIGKDIFYSNIQIKYEYKNKEEVFVYGFKNEVKQVLLNIINNAKTKIINICKKHDFKGIITIKVSQNKNNCIVNIIDNAGAIDSDIIDLVFNPYFTTKNNGTGIGLYMAKVIIEDRMSGKVSVKNKNQNVIFKIQMPLQGLDIENITPRR